MGITTEFDITTCNGWGLGSSNNGGMSGVGQHNYLSNRKMSHISVGIGITTTPHRASHARRKKARWRFAPRSPVRSSVRVRPLRRPLSRMRGGEALQSPFGSSSENEGGGAGETFVRPERQKKMAVWPLSV